MESKTHGTFANKASETVTGEKRSLVDTIIGDKLLNDINLLYRARILVNAWILFSVALIIIGSLVAIFPMKAEARWSGMALCFFIAINLSILLLTFHRSGNYHLYGNISVGMAFIAIAVSVSLAGTPIYSPSIGLFYLIPILAVFFLGKRSCWLWSSLVVFVVLCLLLLDFLHFPFPSFYDEVFLVQTRFMSVFVGIIGVLGMVITYEVSNKKLRKDKKTEYERLEFLAHNDQLTRLLNRASFEDKMELSIAHLGLEQKNEKLALIYMDLDGFKPVNDIHGHKAGDLILKMTADRIQYLLQNQGYAARHGGDEFLLLLEHVQNSDEVVEFTQKLLHTIAQPIVYEGVELKVTASVGVAFFPKDAQDISSLMRNADAAMYQAKTHKNDFVLFQRT